MKKRKATRRVALPATRRSPAVASKRLLGDLRALIERSREQIARTVNSELVTLYWSIGRRIRQEVLKEKRRIRRGDSADAV